SHVRRSASHGLPSRLRLHHDRCTPVSRRLPASPKSAAAGHQRTKCSAANKGGYSACNFWEPIENLSGFLPLVAKITVARTLHDGLCARELYVGAKTLREQEASGHARKRRRREHPFRVEAPFRIAEAFCVATVGCRDLGMFVRSEQIWIPA